MRRRRFRAVALRDVAARPADVPAALAVEMTQAAAACAIYLPLLEHLTSTGFGELAAIDSPVQIAWGTKDRILPWPGYAERFRRMTPQARWVELQALGHCPMLDDASLTARAVARSVATTAAPARPPRKPHSTESASGGGSKTCWRIATSICDSSQPSPQGELVPTRPPRVSGPRVPRMRLPLAKRIPLRRSPRPCRSRRENQMGPE
jgi:hypothetical protein